MLIDLHTRNASVVVATLLACLPAICLLWPATSCYLARKLSFVTKRAELACQLLLLLLSLLLAVNLRAAATATSRLEWASRLAGALGGCRGLASALQTAVMLATAIPDARRFGFRLWCAAMARLWAVAGGKQVGGLRCGSLASRVEPAPPRSGCGNGSRPSWQARKLAS